MDDFMAAKHIDLDFSGVDAAVLTGPVGSGKTSVIEAFRWAMWGKSRAGVDADLIRRGTPACQVRIEVEAEGRLLAITRQRARNRGSAKLTLEVDGDLQTFATSPLTQPDIIRRVGLTHDAALAGPMMLQSDDGALMRVQPAQAKALLVALLVGTRWDGWHAEAKRRRDEATGEAAAAASRVERLTGQIANAASARALLAEREAKRAETEERLVALRAAVLRATAEVAALRERAERAAVVARQSGDAAIAEQLAESALRKTEDVARVTRQELQDLQEPSRPPDSLLPLEEAVAATRAVQEATSLALAHAHAKLMSFGSAKEIVCPECGNIFIPGFDIVEKDAAEEAHTAAKAANDDASAAANAAMQALNAASAAQRKWEGFLNQRSQLTAKLESLAERTASDTARLAEKVAAHAALRAEAADLMSVASAMATSQRQLDADSAALKLREADATDLDQRIANGRAYVAEVEVAERDLPEAEGALLVAQVRVGLFGALTKAYHRDGIPSALLDSGVPAIEDRANEVLARMPDDMAMRLRTQALTQSGTVSDELNIVVEMGGEESPYAMLSGGQQFRADIAVRMGLTAALASVAWETLFIDEGLDRWQDAEGREAMLETLAEVQDDFGMTLVVSHEPHVVERIPARVVFSRVDGISTAEWA